MRFVTFKQYQENKDRFSQVHRPNPETGKIEPVDPDWEIRQQRNQERNNLKPSIASQRPIPSQRPMPSQEEMIEQKAREMIAVWVHLTDRNTVKNILQKDDPEIINFGKFRGNKKALATMMPTSLSRDPNAKHIISLMKSLAKQGEI